MALTITCSLQTVVQEYLPQFSDLLKTIITKMKIRGFFCFAFSFKVWLSSRWIAIHACNPRSLSKKEKRKKKGWSCGYSRVSTWHVRNINIYRKGTTRLVRWLTKVQNYHWNETVCSSCLHVNVFLWMLFGLGVPLTSAHLAIAACTHRFGLDFCLSITEF